MEITHISLWTLWCTTFLYLSLKSVLLRAGATKSKFDDSMFFWSINNKLQGVTCYHVDDFCWGGSHQFQSIIIDKIRETFSISQEEIKTFKWLGSNIIQTNGCISIDQNLYIDKLSELEIISEKQAHLKKEEAWQLHGLVGQLNWVPNEMSPDMAHSACEVFLLKMPPLLTLSRQIKTFENWNLNVCH